MNKDMADYLQQAMVQMENSWDNIIESFTGEDLFIGS